MAMMAASAEVIVSKAGTGNVNPIPREGVPSLQVLERYRPNGNGTDRNGQSVCNPSAPQNFLNGDSIHEPSLASSMLSSTSRGRTDEGNGRIVTSTRPDSCPRGHSTLFCFTNSVDKATYNHLREVILAIEGLIQPHIQTFPKPNLVSIRSMYLGKDEADISPYIVICCMPNQISQIQNSVDTALVRGLCEFPGQFPLKVLVTQRKLRSALAVSDINVYYNPATMEAKTFCGAPIFLGNDSEVVAWRPATVGGIVKVAMEDGLSKLYGMTAGHVLEDCHNAPRNIGNGGGTGSVDDEKGLSAQLEYLEKGKDSLGSQVALESKGQGISETWEVPSFQMLGRVINNQKIPAAPDAANQSRHPSHGWMLFSINCLKANEVCTLQYPQHYESRQLLLATQPSLNDGLSDPAIMLSSRGQRRGEISSLPSRILIGCSDTFVDTYILTLNEEHAVCDGDSGSWVVNSSSPEVYGHVVATDSFGHAYVVPLLETLDEIKEFMGATSVCLPSVGDCVGIISDPGPALSDFVPAPCIELPGDFVPAPCTELPGAPVAAASVQSANIVRSTSLPLTISHLENKGTLSHYYTKEWNPVFSENRDFKEDGSYVEYKRSFGAEGDDLGLFLQDLESSIPSCQVEEVKEFCLGVLLDDLKSGAGAAGQRRAAWLDDRRCARVTSDRYVRYHGNPLTATALYRLLKAARFDIPEVADADRRLIYIANLDPAYILALAETASFHQLSVLRDAIWKHLALQTSIMVKIPHRGYSIFQLEFHVPYFAMRTSPPPVRSQRTARKTTPPRQWIDLDFLEIQPRNSQNPKHYGIHEAQISFALCGPDDGRWVGYAFVDTEFDGEDLTEDNFSYEGIHEDPIALGERDANLPIWDPREYFLVIVEIRMAQVMKEWEYLVRTVERSITRYRSQHHSTLSQHLRKTRDRAEDGKMTFDWTQQTMELLSQLLDVISKPIKAWQSFNSSNGDIGYFSRIESLSDISQCRTRLSLRAINETFQNLKSLQQTLLLLEKSCRQSAEALQLRLTLEGNESLEHNGFATELTILTLSPIAITIAYFSMPQAVVPFELNSKSFTISIFIIMAVVRLLFIAQCALSRGPSYWVKATVWIMKRRVDAVSYGRTAMRGQSGTHSPRSAAEGIGLEILAV